MGAKIQVNLKTKELELINKECLTNADRIVAKIANDWAGYAIGHMTVSPSDPGEPPGVDTGALKNSIGADQVKPGVWKVHDGVEYGAYLEFGTAHMAARPWFEPSLQIIKDRLPSDLKELIK